MDADTFTRNLGAKLGFADLRTIRGGDSGYQIGNGNTRIGIGGNITGVGGVHLLTLARLGVGAFHIADFDTFDIANFNRQVGATMSTLGQPKVDVLADMARHGQSPDAASKEACRPGRAYLPYASDR